MFEIKVGSRLQTSVINDAAKLRHAEAYEMTTRVQNIAIAGLLALTMTGACSVSASSTPEAPSATSKMDPHMDHSKMVGMGDMTIPADAAPSTKAFMEANQKMHADMAITYTGDPDRDFMTGMIPHHEGAVAMAKIVLAQGKDPEVRKLAEDVIAAQEKEIGQMKAWLTKSPAP
jgi:Domain of unknown function (DUF305)